MMTIMFGFAAAVATKLLTTSAANVANLIAAELLNFIMGDFPVAIRTRAQFHSKPISNSSNIGGTCVPKDKGLSPYLKSNLKRTWPFKRWPGPDDGNRPGFAGSGF
jgi:hypothetical protein